MVLVAFLWLTLTSCATFSRQDWLPLSAYEPKREEITTVPFFPQKAHHCGPATLAMVLAWTGIPVEPDDVAAKVFTPSEKGTLQAAMISAARRFGRIAYPISGPDELLAEVVAHHPVIVLQNLGLSWFPRWHYSVVVGYDLTNRHVLLHSGTTQGKLVPLNVFDKTWARSARWGLLVLRPDNLPATATEARFVSAVVGLERARHWNAAVTGYKTALVRWPRSFGALMGLGNTYYALDEKALAAHTFRIGTERFPTEGSAFNNLAQVLWEQGERKGALKAARRAVALGGPLSDVYRETLEQIEANVPTP
jgi:hypothetical protein